MQHRLALTEEVHDAVGGGEAGADDEDGARLVGQRGAPMRDHRQLLALDAELSRYAMRADCEDDAARKKRRTGPIRTLDDPRGGATAVGTVASLAIARASHRRSAPRPVVLLHVKVSGSGDIVLGNEATRLAHGGGGGGGLGGVRGGCACEEKVRERKPRQLHPSARGERARRLVHRVPAAAGRRGIEEYVGEGGAWVAAELEARGPPVPTVHSGVLQRVEEQRKRIVRPAAQSGREVAGGTDEALGR